MFQSQLVILPLLEDITYISRQITARFHEELNTWRYLHLYLHIAQYQILLLKKLFSVKPCGFSQFFHPILKCLFFHSYLLYSLSKPYSHFAIK